MNSEGSSLVGSGTNHGTLSLPRNDHRLAAQLRIIALFNRSVERVHVDMDDFSHEVGRHELAGCFGVLPMVDWKAQHNLTLQFLRPCGNQSRAILGEIPAEHASDVKQRRASAYQTSVVRAVADNITFGAQDGILQCDRIENPPPFGDVFGT